MLGEIYCFYHIFQLIFVVMQLDVFFIIQPSRLIEWNCNSRCKSVYVCLKLCGHTLLRIFLLFLVELQLIRIDPVSTCMWRSVTCMCIWINRFCLFAFARNQYKSKGDSHIKRISAHTHTHTCLKAIVVNTQNGMNTYRFRDELRSKKITVHT